MGGYFAASRCRKIISLRSKFSTPGGEVSGVSDLKMGEAAGEDVNIDQSLFG